MHGKGLLLAGCLALTGCTSFFSYGVHNAAHDASQQVHDAHERQEHHHTALRAWRQVECQEGRHSPDYRDGFLNGFATYLYAGEPSPLASLPSRYYTCTEYQRAAGQAAIQEWLAGFRHGVDAARMSGRRERVVLPVAVSDGFEIQRPLFLTPTEAP